ncbi:hypothetical protein AOLI_G00283880 [Acnodon oligacanthus]
MAACGETRRRSKPAPAPARSTPSLDTHSSSRRWGPLSYCAVSQAAVLLTNGHNECHRSCLSSDLQILAFVSDDSSQAASDLRSEPLAWSRGCVVRGTDKVSDENSSSRVTLDKPNELQINLSCFFSALMAPSLLLRVSTRDLRPPRGFEGKVSWVFDELGRHYSRLPQSGAAT